MSFRFKAFLNTLAEARVHGCPSVSYDGDAGPHDIIRHDVDGLLVRPVGDVPGLPEALGSLAIEARERFAAENIMQRWGQLPAGCYTQQLDTQSKWG